MSADHDTAENYLEEFAKVMLDEKFSPEQVYNADRTALYWWYMPSFKNC